MSFTLLGRTRTVRLSGSVSMQARNAYALVTLEGPDPGTFQITGTGRAYYSGLMAIGDNDDAANPLYGYGIKFALGAYKETYYASGTNYGDIHGVDAGIIVRCARDTQIVTGFNIGSDVLSGSFTIDLTLQEQIIVDYSGSIVVQENIQAGSTITVNATFGPLTISHTAIASGYRFAGEVDVEARMLCPAASGPSFGELRDSTGNGSAIAGTWSLTGGWAYSSGNSFTFNGAAIASLTQRSGIISYKYYRRGGIYSGLNTEQDWSATYAGGITINYLSQLRTPTGATDTGAYAQSLPYFVGSLVCKPPSGFDLKGKLFAGEDGYPQPVQIDEYWGGPPLNGPRAIPTPDGTVIANPDFTDSRSAQSSTSSVSINFAASPSLPGDPPSWAEWVFGSFQQDWTVVGVYGLQLNMNPPALKGLKEDMGMSINGDGIHFPVPIYWKQYDAFTLDQESEFPIEDGSTLAPADGTWTADPGITLSVTAGAVHADIPSGQASPQVFRRWTFGKERNFGSYRYCAVRFRISGGGGPLPVTITVANRDRTDLKSGQYRKYNVQSGTDGAWIEAVLDLCSPDEFGTVDNSGNLVVVPLPDVDSQQTRYPLPTSDDAYWGATKVQLLRFQLLTQGVGRSLEVQYIDLRRNGPLTYSMHNPTGNVLVGNPRIKQGILGVGPVVAPGFRAVTDGRLSLEVVTSGLNLQFDGLVHPTITDIIADINHAIDSYGNENTGITAAAAGSGGFPDAFHTNDAVCTFIGGGNGILAARPGDTFSHYIDQTARTVKAQSSFNSIIFYPDCGDALGFSDGHYGGNILVRAAQRLRSDVSGILINLNAAAIEGGRVDVTDQDMSAGSGSGAARSDGYYTTGLPYGRGNHKQLTKPRARFTAPQWLATWASRWRHRVSFRYTPQDAGDTSRNPFNRAHRVHGYHRAAVMADGNVYYWRSDVAVPYPHWDLRANQVTGTGDASDPRPCEDHRGRVYLVVTRTPPS